MFPKHTSVSNALKWVASNEGSATAITRMWKSTCDLIASRAILLNKNCLLTLATFSHVKQYLFHFPHLLYSQQTWRKWKHKEGADLYRQMKHALVYGNMHLGIAVPRL